MTTMTAITTRTTPRRAQSSAIERQLREQILLSVDKILLRDKPSRASLYALLKLCNPNLEPEVLDNAVAREKAYRSVKARLHPDKFEVSRQPKMTEVFQNVQVYYVQCCHALADEVVGRYKKRRDSTNSATATRPFPESPTNKHKRTNSPNSVIEIPLAMDVFIKYPQLRQMLRPSPFQAVSTSELHYHLAYACLNFRGAVMHGQAIDCTYQVPANLVETMQTPSSIEAVWAEAGLDYKRLTTVDDIKLDIMRHGPVVSTSFVLDPYYYKTNVRNAGNFSERHVGKLHPMLITGWTMSTQGEVWCVQALRGPTFTVGMGQFDIDKLCLAPPSHDLEQKSWQAPGPFWDIGNLGSKCPQWRDHFSCSSPLTVFDVLPLTSTDLEHLGDLFSVGLHTVIMERRAFVVRDKLKQAQSRRVMLKDMTRVEYIDGQKVWKVTLAAVRK